MKLTVDGASCMGHGRCYLMAPDLLTYDDEGYVTIRDQTIDVPADQVEAAEDAEGTCPEQAITLIPMTRPRGRRRRRPVRLLRSRPAAEAGRRGRPVRRAADAVRARARRRRARPPEDQVGHADVRADRAASGLPLLRRRRARRRRDGRGAARALPRGRLRGRHADRQPARDPGRRPRRARSPPPSSSPGTTATRRTPTRRSTCRCSRAVVIGNGNVAIDVARMLVLDPDELASTDTADHAIAAFAAAVRHRRGRPRPPRARAGGVHEPGAARARRAGARRRRRRPGRARARSGQRRVARVGRRLAHRRRNVDMLREFAARAADREVAPDRAALLPLAGRGPRRRGRAGDRPARRPQPARAGSARRRARGAHRRAGGDPLRARDPLDRLPRPPAAGSPVRRAPRPDPQRRRPGVRGGRHAAARRVRGRLDQARAVRGHRHEQEVRRRHRRRAARGPGGRPARRTRRRPAARPIEAWLRARVPGLVTWRGWEAIDEHERARGAPAGRPRVKLVRVPEMLAVAGQKTGVSV